ncbi:Nucleotide exchange factor SIL1 [Lachnellula suecica]|uniref:Nucleotide exchange factor SIL1 n=1 Tax=Lachnellula suecica TaxID=602035 RepID=A0A8T9C418_9HELO|nr:Nucleotide exchange factor SIL1 [Lachnellula suecica]
MEAFNTDNNTNPQQYLQYLTDDLYEESSDTESLASLETDDGQDHPPERILAQVKAKNDFIWYLVKWQDCPVIRSSWEGRDLFSNSPWILDAWAVEQQKQAEGLTKPLDLNEFNKAVSLEESAVQRRRVLRRLKRRFNRVLSISTNDSSPYQLPTNMVQIPTRCLLGMAWLLFPILASANSPSSKSPSTDLICPTDNAAECYPRIFQPTKDFQDIKEGQDIPPGLHVRMNIYSGQREARLNIPMEGEEGYNLEGLPTEQAVVVVDQPESEPEKPALRDQVPIKPPVYQDAGKIPPPIPDPASGDDFGTFQKSLLAIKMEARAFDKALDDLAELSHDIYYGVEIAKDGPVLEKLVCLTLGSGSEKMPATENGRDRKAASILASSLQNNPTALNELSSYWKMVVYPTCGFDVSANTQKDFVNMLRSRLGREKDPNALKAKVSAFSGLLREPTVRKQFLESHGMELLLAMFLKKGEQFDVVRRKVGELVMDNFLDEGMGAAVGEWPKLPASETEVCEAKEKMLGDGCWEHHVEAFSKSLPKAAWTEDFLAILKEQRQNKGSSSKTEL